MPLQPSRTRTCYCRRAGIGGSSRALHGGRGGQLSRLLGPLSEADRAAFRFPQPEVLAILDPRPLLDEAASIAARFGNTGWLVAETLVAGRHHGRLWFGEQRNVGERLEQAADQLSIDVKVIGPTH